MLRESLSKVFLWTRDSFVLDNPKPGFTRALILLGIMVLVISPPMRFLRSNSLLLILMIGISYHILLGLVALAKYVPADDFPTVTIDEEEPTSKNTPEPVVRRVENRRDRDPVDKWFFGLLDGLEETPIYVPEYSELSLGHLSVLMRLDAREEVADSRYDGLKEDLVFLGLVSNRGRLRPYGVRLARHLKKLGHAEQLRLWTRDREQATRLIVNS